MAAILTILVRINLPKFVQFKEYYGYGKLDVDHVFFCSEKYFSLLLHLSG